MVNKKDIQMEIVFYDDDRQSQKRLVLNNPEDYKITNKAQSDAYAKMMIEKGELNKDTRGGFVIAKIESLRALENSGVTISDRTYLMQLVLYSQFNGEPLTKNGEPLSSKSIAELWGVTPKVASARLNKFINAGLLKVIPNKQDSRVKNYLLHEGVFLRGSGVKGDEKFVKLFLKKLAEIMNNVKELEEREKRKNKKPAEIIDVIGLLNAVMPYFHYQTYYLVKNYNADILLEGESVNEALERDHTQLKHLSRTDIGKILGHKRADTRTIDKYMDYLQAAGAVMVTKNKNKRRYLIHPDLLFRMGSTGMDDYTRTIRNQFNQHN